jgi:superfamily II DNA or RNA helicase
MDSEIDFLEDEAEEFPPEVSLPMPNGFALRDYQLRCLQAIKEAWASYSRVLCVLPTGSGKTLLEAYAIKVEVDAGKKVLFIAHTEELLDQAAEKIFRSTGLESEREKADQHASLSASVVIASIQTLAKDARLMGFPDDHFSLVVIDEAHRSLAFSYQKVACYFHFGEASLDEAWVIPEPGFPFKYKARLIGFTATADRGDRRSLGELYQSVCFEYGMIDACKDGYLVRPIVKNIPLKIDLKGVRISRSQGGADYDKMEVAARLAPILRELAAQIAKEALDRKVIVFLPSVDSAQRMAEAAQEAGFNASFVSGACEDRAEKISAFRAAGAGTLMANAMLLVEGFDAPDVSCVCVLRPTKIRSLWVQCAGRGSRPLTGLIDGMATKEERCAAIAASAKPNLLLLDPLWLSDRLDLIHPIDLVATRAEVRQKMAEAIESGATTDLLSLEATATRDLMKSLEAAARKHANKQARVIDPLSWAVSLGDAALASWEPSTIWDELPATAPQLDFIRKQHIDTTNIVHRGHAQKIIVRLLARMKLHLAPVIQLNFMRQLGVPEEIANTLTKDEASRVIDKILEEKKSRRAATSSL